MKNKILLCVLCVSAFIGSATAQTIIPIGAPVTINGQTFEITTNPAGALVISTSGTNGSATVTTPSSEAELLQDAERIIAANNPANASYYGTNELVARVAAAYLQNSGQSVAEIAIEKYGLISSLPHIGAGAALFEGNRNGQSGTAAAAAFADYRKIIGDVSAQIGVGGGYDNWNHSALVLTKTDVELRQNPHLGEFVGVGFVYEPTHSNQGGLLFHGGVNYAF